MRDTALTLDAPNLVAESQRRLGLRRCWKILSRAGSWCTVASWLLLSSANAQQSQDSKVAFFENEIRPLLDEYCFECHSSQEGDIQGGLDLGSKRGLLKGGDSGPLIDKLHPENSLLLEVIGYENRDLQMPPEGKLPPDKIATFRTWIEKGAFDPRVDSLEQAEQAIFDLHQRRQEHWAWQPIREPEWNYGAHRGNTSRIDRLIEDRLRQVGLGWAGPGSPGVNLRRLHFDLAGLPPSTDDMEEFNSHSQAAPRRALEEKVDKLLASPRFGEHWATMWLDLFRYSETKGHVTDQERPFAWKYRDYVINALNDDVPYDRLVIEHLAGDLLPKSEQRAWGKLSNVSTIATGGLFMHEMHFMSVDPVQQRWDEINAQIDVVGKAFLGITTECARCHDHKFDAISQEDYYALAGFFLSTEQGKSRTAPRATLNQANLSKLKKAEAAYETFLSSKIEGRRKAQSPKVGGQYFPISEELGVQSPGDTAKLFKLMGELTLLDSSWSNWARSAKDAHGVDATLLIRGSHKTPANLVARRLPEALGGDTLPDQETQGSGRLWLARRLVDERNPLVARVWANRIWQQLFGTGIVPTPSNFGKNGAKPSNLTLLDYLAFRLIELEWSTKALVREIVLSDAYLRQSLGQDDSRETRELELLSLERDPAFRLLAVRPNRRLSGEQIRDSLLAISGRLKKQIGGTSVDAFVPVYATANKPSNVPKSGPLDGDGRRAVYLKVRRNFPDPFLSKFDFPDRGKSSGKRTETQVPSQALAMMNSEFVHLMAGEWGQRMASDRTSTNIGRLKTMWQTALGRSASDEEMRVLELAFNELLDRHQHMHVENCSEPAVWTDVAHVLFNHPEFLWLD